jgi:predicted porin
MKKTLIALAALAATGAFAQSNVGIVGTFDVGYKITSAPTTSSGTTLTPAPNSSSSVITGNNTATSSLRFVGSEDLGGGMKANLLAEINPNVWQSSVADTNNTFAATYNGTPFNGEQYIGLSGGFGDVKLGVPNAGFFGVAMMAGPMGTAMGSGYGATGVSRLGTVAPGVVSGVNSGTSRIVRHERTVAYTTPNMNGFTGQIDYAAKNDNQAIATTTAAVANGNTDGYQSVTLKYSNGPLNVAFSNAVNTFGVNTFQTLGTVPSTGSYQSTGTNAYDGSYTYNILAGNYTFGATTVYAGYTNTKSSGNVAPEDSKSWNLAFKYSMGAVDLMGNYLVRSSNLDPATAYGFNTATTTTGVVSAANVNGTLANNAKVFGLGADYNLSKRTALYARYELTDANTDGKDPRAGFSTSTGITTGGSITNAFAVGMRHSF